MKWFLNLPYLVRIGLALSFAAAAFLAIMVMQGERSANERTWAIGEREIQHEQSRIPLTVYVDQSFGDGHLGSARKAVESMNDVGCTVVVIVPKLEGADIHIRHEACDRDADRKPNHPGCTWFNLKTGQLIIQVGQPGNVTTSFLIFWHELCHAFGLDHDGIYRVPKRTEDSLMFVPITANNAHEHAYRLGHGLFLPRMSDVDTKVFTKRYCP